MGGDIRQRFLNDMQRLISCSSGNSRWGTRLMTFRGSMSLRWENCCGQGLQGMKQTAGSIRSGNP